MEETLLGLFKQVLNAKYKTIPQSDASFNYERRQATLYIFFEHSKGAIDWRNNFDFPARPYRTMNDRWYVHRGFLHVWQSAKAELEQPILQPDVQKIIIVGYSHGAALALLCHEFCVFNRPDLADNIYGYGFGCPRVVHGPLRRKISERFKNFQVIRNCRDIVTHLPPALFGFHHVGKMVHIGRHAKYGPLTSHKAESYLEQLTKAKNGCS